MIEQAFARRFAEDWIASWNAHDLDRILRHYTDDFEMSSPIIARIANEASGTLRGKATIRTYWTKALAQHPELHFELVDVLIGARSVTVLYRGHRGLTAEVFWFDSARRIYRAAAHYVGLPTTV